MLFRRSDARAACGLALLLTACAPEVEDRAESGAYAAEEALEQPVPAQAPAGLGVLTLADASTGPQLDSIAAFARGDGLIAMPPTVAITSLRTFEVKLRNTGEPALVAIADDLGELRAELESEPVDREDVAATMGRLGPKVTAVADRAGALTEPLRAIGVALTNAADRLLRP